MAGWLRIKREKRERRWRRRNRRTGCLMWLVIVILALIAIALFFGGFTKGTKVGSIPAPARLTAAAGPPSAAWAVGGPVR
jgi:hypothetical protein